MSDFRDWYGLLLGNAVPTILPLPPRNAAPSILPLSLLPSTVRCIRSSNSSNAAVSKTTFVSAVCIECSEIEILVNYGGKAWLSNQLNFLTRRIFTDMSGIDL